MMPAPAKENDPPPQPPPCPAPRRKTGAPPCPKTGPPPGATPPARRCSCPCATTRRLPNMPPRTRPSRPWCTPSACWASGPTPPATPWPKPQIRRARSCLWGAARKARAAPQAPPSTACRSLRFQRTSAWMRPCATPSWRRPTSLPSPMPKWPGCTAGSCPSTCRPCWTGTSLTASSAPGRASGSWARFAGCTAALPKAFWRPRARRCSHSAARSLWRGWRPAARRTTPALCRPLPAWPRW